MKIGNYGRYKFKVGDQIKDKNGFYWEVLGFGKKEIRVANEIMHGRNKETDFTQCAFWHFFENIIERGTYTNKLKLPINY